MKVTVVGGGKVGYYLVKTLLEHGHEPTMIEIDSLISVRLSNELDIPIICGDGTSIDVLTHSGVQDSDVIICVSGNDEVNLVACQLAKTLFNVKKSIARVNNPKNSEAMKELGIDIVISSANIIAGLLEREVHSSAIKKVLSLAHGEGAISEIQIPKNYELDGIALIDLKLPKNINVISITRKDELIIPRGLTQIKGGDLLLIISTKLQEGKLLNLLKI